MKRKKAPEEGASWMDTYGDMVTLLLCFFVLLYSISSVDEVKWKALVKSLNAGTDQEVTELVMKSSQNAGDTVEGADKKEDLTFDELYTILKKSVKEIGIEDQTEISKGDGFTFISFRDKIFFDGDSSYLKKEGEVVLDEFAKVLKKVSSHVQEVQIIGHTSQGDPNIPNNVRNDRTLSALRSMEVTVYLQEKNVISPDKLVSVSYGQFRPIATFKTKEGRARNRRVEILITENNAVAKNLQQYYEEVYKEK
ncbi:MAG: flagellar motor protein MotB [Clostridiales bacterium]|nr:flagellar motor protein MotB [Clostridiales bacterium]